MSTRKISDLNDDCLFEIFRQIKANCELDNKLQKKTVDYWDLINFVISCLRFVKVFNQWSSVLYHELHIEFALLQATKVIEIDFEKVYDSLQNVPRREREIYWDLCFNAIRENKDLGRLTLNYKPTRYYPEHLERFQAVVDAIRHKNSLRILNVYVEGEFDMLRAYNKCDLRTLSLQAIASKMCQSSTD